MDQQLKQKLTLIRNKKSQRIQEHLKLHEQSRQIAREAQQESFEIATGADSPDNMVKEPTGCARLQEVRNKLTGRKTMAKERWNRFAGTAAAGGRGL